MSSDTEWLDTGTATWDSENKVNRRLHPRVLHRGTEYCVDDVAYIEPNSSDPSGGGNPWIVRIDALWEDEPRGRSGGRDFMMTITWYYRPEDKHYFLEPVPDIHPRELVSSTHIQDQTILCIIGKAYVFSLELYTQHNLQTNPHAYFTRLLFNYPDLFPIPPDDLPAHCIAINSPPQYLPAALAFLLPPHPHNNNIHVNNNTPVDYPDQQQLPPPPAAIAREVVARRGADVLACVDGVAAEMEAAGCDPRAAGEAAVGELMAAVEDAEREMEEFFRGWRAREREPTYEEVLRFVEGGGLEAKMMERARRK